MNITIPKTGRTSTRKPLKRITAPEPARFPHIINEDETGVLIQYSRNVVSWNPKRKG